MLAHMVFSTLEDVCVSMCLGASLDWELRERSLGFWKTKGIVGVGW